MSTYHHYGLKKRDTWIGFSSAEERYKAHRWRVGFAILMCILAAACVAASLLQ